MKKDTDKVGAISEAAVTLLYTRMGYVVSKPTAKCKYDLLVDDGQKIWKVQVKTGRIKGDTILANWSQSYQDGDLDWFVIYCPSLDRTFQVEWNKASPCKSLITLRLKPTKSGRRKGCLFAEDFELRM